MAVPFLDLKAQYATIQEEVESAVLRVMRSTGYVLGDDVAEFEAEFSRFSGARHGVAVNSGTSALHLALVTAGIQPGDEVITVASTFVATVAAIEYAGGRPVFVDVDPGTLNMDPALIESKISDRTRAILPVHLHGHPSDLDPILDVARQNRLTVIEDAAQAHDAEYRGKRIGGISSMSCFSFYPGKNLGACGEGGIVTTDDDDLATRMRQLRDWGQTAKYAHEHRGFNYRMDGVQGAALRVKLRHLHDWTEGRRAAAKRYGELLAGTDVQTPIEASYARHVYHVYAIRSRCRDALQQELTQRGIGTGIHYPIPVHLQPAYRDLGFGVGDLPVTEKAAGELLSLPMYAELSDAQIAEVCEAVAESVTAIGPASASYGSN